MTTAIDPDVDDWLKLYKCTSCEELYTKLEQIHKEQKPVEGEHVPFSLQDLKHQDDRQKIDLNLSTYWSAHKADKLTRYLRKNPPKESCENPVIHQCSSYKENMAMTNLIINVDLPGSKYNPFGMVNYSDLFLICSLETTQISMNISRNCQSRS